MSPTKSSSDPFGLEHPVQQECSVSHINPALITQLKTTIDSLNKKADQQVADFNSLLAGIDSVDPKLKALWSQIYENAAVDRRNAMIVWSDLYVNMIGNVDMHAIHGDKIAKYMERAEKANAQLLKLADLVHKAKEQEEVPDVFVSSAEVFDMLEGKATPTVISSKRNTKQ